MTVSRVLIWIVNIVLAAVILITAAAFINGWRERDNARYVPGLGRYKIISVLSDSMKPVMCAGDAILVDSGRPGQLKEGDIITFWRQGGRHSLLTHRIVDVADSKGEKNYYTRGDANNVIDGQPIRKGDIVGKYLLCIPRGGYLINFVHTKTGFMLLIMLPILTAIYSYTRKIYLDIVACYKKEKNGPNPGH